jgi:hypothetical protein
VFFVRSSWKHAQRIGVQRRKLPDAGVEFRLPALLLGGVGVKHIGRLGAVGLLDGLPHGGQPEIAVVPPVAVDDVHGVFFGEKPAQTVLPQSSGRPGARR